MSRRMRAFKRWMVSHCIVYSDALEFVDSPDDGISVRALYDLKEGDLVATIPKRSCLTIRTSGISPLIEASGLDGCLGLALALMYERSLGAASPWEGYLQILPDRECVPFTWSLEEVDDLLVGTELHKIVISTRQTVKEDKIFLVEDWKEYIEPLIQSGPLEMDWAYFGVKQYFSAKSLIASRSFEIDEYHGSVNGPNGTLEMIVVKEVEAGGEVFNTYGCMGNAALLHKYGFTESNNPFNIVNIDLDQFLVWCSSSFSNRYCRSRLASWRKLKFSGCFSQVDSEYFEIDSDGEPQLELRILLYVMFLSETMHQKLNCGIDSLTRATEADKLIKLLEMTQTDSREQRSEDLEELLLTDDVCQSLLCLADIRETLYGTSSLKEEISRLQNCCRMKERKLYYSLVLRLSERKIIGRLRSYAHRYLNRQKAKCK
ncbi:hypothetical protein KSP39_PZI004246 [Platanthera zijinensis]|uniref:Uncharacterized protein n=1 Tax=Platanthera zijinensis TaxID=2320716 RepID=A0AAP0BYR1_9ASPA